MQKEIYTKEVEICKYGTSTKKKCARGRQKYTNVQPEQKKATIGQNVANREFKGNTSCKESIVMENPSYVETEEELCTSIRRALHG